MEEKIRQSEIESLDPAFSDASSDVSPCEGPDTLEPEEDFKTLLEEYFRTGKSRPLPKPHPIPLKKRLRRYPPPEKDLDLHGYTALGAEVKARSFILSCHHQGFFTIRIVVGKGRHSEMGPVLPDVVEDVARQARQQGWVLAYEWDRRTRSVSGALILYLRQFGAFDQGQGSS